MAQPAKTRILLIEDDARFRIALSQLLIQAGFEVVDAEEGAEGIRLYNQQPADVVITDLIMPGKEGMETILELRRIHPDVKIIAISGGGRVRSTEYLTVAEAVGANCVISKPFPFDRLLCAIAELVDA